MSLYVSYMHFIFLYAFLVANSIVIIQCIVYDKKITYFIDVHFVVLNKITIYCTFDRINGSLYTKRIITKHHFISTTLLELKYESIWVIIERTNWIVK